jgi:hypothetical protein
MSTCDSASRLISFGMPSGEGACDCAGGCRVLDFANTSRNTNPSEESWGVTVSVMPVLICSVAACDEPATPAAPVLMTVPVLGSLTRRISRLSILAAGC